MLMRDKAALLLRHPWGWLASGFGSGLSPITPGTTGSAAALVVWWFLLRDLSMPMYALVLLATFLIGVVAGDWTIRKLGVEDPGVIVIDEFLGLWITLILLPDGWADILKPWPASWADRRIKGGFGTMLDDAFAGLYGLLAMQAASWYLA
jgi:phosphatidylglycerophosphatase A